MNRYILGVFLLGVLFLLSVLAQTTMNLKEMSKEKWGLEEENHNLKEKIDDLEEKKNGLKEMVMEFKGGELTKGELIKGVQALIDEEEIEETRKITEYNKEIKALFEK